MSNGADERFKDPMGYDPWQLFSTVTPLDEDYERPNQPYG